MSMSLSAPTCSSECRGDCARLRRKPRSTRLTQRQRLLRLGVGVACFEVVHQRKAREMVNAIVIRMGIQRTVERCQRPIWMAQVHENIREFQSSRHIARAATSWVCNSATRWRTAGSGGSAGLTFTSGLGMMIAAASSNRIAKSRMRVTTDSIRTAAPCSGPAARRPVPQDSQTVAESPGQILLARLGRENS